MATTSTWRDIKRNSKGIVRVPITTDLNGGEVCLPVHVLRGSAEGPTLTLLATTHGDQWFNIEAMRRVVARADTHDLRGTVLVVPVANPVAFNQLVRCMPDRSDAPDLQRVFPGGNNWLSEQIAQTIVAQVLSRTDYLIDFHNCPWGASLMMVVYGIDLPNAEVIQQSRLMARAFGCPSVNKARLLTVFPGPKAVLSHAAAVLGIPSIAAEIGGPGFSPALEESWIESNVTGVWNVMIHLGMLRGSLKLPSRCLYWERMVMVTPRVGGLLEPRLGADSLMEEVEAGQLLGRVLSPFTFKELEELKAPVDGAIIVAPRAYPARPGDWSYVLADTGPEVSQWEDLS